MRIFFGILIGVILAATGFFFFSHGATVEKWTTINKEKLPVSPLSKRIWEAKNQYDVNKSAGCAKKFGGIDELIRKAENQDDIGFEAEQCLEQIINGSAPKKTEYRRTYGHTAPQPSALQVAQRPNALGFKYNPRASNWLAVASSTQFDNGTCTMRCESDTVIKIKNTEYLSSTQFPCDILHVGGLIAVRSEYPQQSRSKEGTCSIRQLSHN